MIPNVADAGIHGILKGKVYDEEGDPAVGASVAILGTKKGAQVKADGSFVITNIVAGDYDVKVSFIGSEPIIKKVRISADITTEVEFSLKQDDVMAAEVLVTADKMVQKTQIGATASFSSEELANTARSGINNLIGLTAGVNTAGGGFSIRGSRTNETQIRVDGMDIGNQFSGGLGAAGTQYYPMVSQFATTEVQVMKGGFSAQYGNAMAGVVNTVVRTGRNDKYEGFVNYRTDLPSLYGSYSEGIVVQQNGSEIDVFEGGPGAQRLGQNLNEFEFGFGGPIPGLNEFLPGGSTVYFTGSYRNEQFRNASYEIYDPLGKNIGQLDNQGAWVKNLVGRALFGLSQDVQLTVGLQYGVTNLENQTYGLSYMNYLGPNQIQDRAGDMVNNPFSGVEERVAKINVTNAFVNNYFAKLNHTLSEQSFYEFRVSVSTNNDISARRSTPGSPNFFSGFDVFEPVDEVRFNGLELEEGPDRSVDIYQTPNATRLSADGLYEGTFRNINPLTGYYEGDLIGSTNNPFGMLGLGFGQHGSTGFSFREGTYFQVDGNYTNIIKDGDFSHTLKGGFEFRLFDQGLHRNNNPWNSDPNYDIYTDKFGGNIYAPNDTIREATSQPFQPYNIAAFFQDQIEYKGIIFTPGLRFEMFEPNSKYRTRFDRFYGIQEADIPETADAFADATAKFMVSPRINVSYPLTDVSVITMNYGIYYQMPQLQNMYDGINTSVLLVNGQIIGDPNLEPQRTNQYQLQYAQQLTDDIAIDISAYYNDIYNQLGYALVGITPNNFYLAQISEYGNNQGIEIELRKRATNNLGFRINYTLARVTGTADGATSNANVINDPFTQVPAFPLAPYPLARDVTHRATGIVDFVWGREEGPELFGIRPLENVNMNFTTTFRSGLPFTLTDAGSGAELSQRNIFRGPSAFFADARISKSFNLSDFFGDGVGGTNIMFYMDIFNLLNLQQVLTLYSANQDPIRPPIVDVNKVGSFDANVFYRDPDLTNPASYAPTQYDQFGERLYNENADLDGNGQVSQQERYQNFLNYAEMTLQTKPNFQAPRSVFFGMIIRF